MKGNTGKALGTMLLLASGTTVGVAGGLFLFSWLQAYNKTSSGTTTVDDGRSVRGIPSAIPYRSTSSYSYGIRG